MTSLEAHAAVFLRFMQYWYTYVGGTQQAPTVPFSTENNRKPQGASRFATIEIRPLDSEQATMGPPPERVGRSTSTRKWLRPAWIDVKLFGPLDEGSKQLYLLADYVTKIFQGKRFAGGGGDTHGITTYATSTTPVKDAEFPALYCLLVRTPFDYYERS
jgi:hypothetical protein